MIISCPNCDTAYNLSEDAISSDGRKIRCKRCSHVFWAKLVSSPSGEKKIEIYYKDKKGEAGQPQKAPSAAPAQTPTAKPQVPNALKNNPLAAKLAARATAVPTPETKTSTPKTSRPTPAAQKPAQVKSSDKESDQPSTEAPTSILDPQAKRKTLGEFDKGKLRNTLGELFGSSIHQAKKDSDASEEEKNEPAQPTAPAATPSTSSTKPAPSANIPLSRGTIMGIPAQRRQTKDFTNDFEFREGSHETSFGMPAINSNFGADRVKKSTENSLPGTHNPTTFGIPVVSKDDAPTDDKDDFDQHTDDEAPRRRQSTLWMLSEDEANEVVSKAAEKEAEQDKKESESNNLDDKVLGAFPIEPILEDPSKGTEHYLETDIKIDLPTDDNEGKSYDVKGPQAPKSPQIPNRSTESDDDKKHNATLFGLAAPISSNTTHYGEDDGADLFNDDVDFDDFFDDPNTNESNLDVDLDLSNIPQDEEPHNSNAESMASIALAEPLKPAEKDTARRLAKFLGRVNAATQQEGDEPQALDDPFANNVNEDFGELPKDDIDVTSSTQQQQTPPDLNFGAEPAVTVDVPAQPKPAVPQDLETVEIEKTVEMSRDFGIELPDAFPTEQTSSIPQQPPLRTSGPIPITDSLPPGYPVNQSFGGAPPSSRPRQVSNNIPSQRPPTGQIPQHRVPNDPFKQETHNPASRTQQIPSHNSTADFTFDDKQSLFDNTENTDIIPRAVPDPQPISKPVAGSILIWIITFIIVIIVGLLVAWFVVMKLLS